MHSMLLACWTYTMRMHSARREHTLKQTQRMHSVLLACGTNDPRMQRCTYGVRSVCARCALDLSRRTCNEYPACAPACLALVQRDVRMYSVLPACAFMHRAPRTFLCITKIPPPTANDNECIALVQRARRTSSACRRTPSERQRTGQNC